MFLRRGDDDTSSGQFDRDVFNEKMKTFDALVHGSDDVSGELLIAPATNDDDVLSLDDSVLESPVPVKKPSVITGDQGALEQTLMISPVKRAKKPPKSPVSSSGRKGLARFLRLQNLQDKRERDISDLEAVWQCSDIMSVAASVPAEIDFDDQQTVLTQGTFDPSSSRSGPGAGMLRRASRASFVAIEDDDVPYSSASVTGHIDANGKERKRSKSLEPATNASNHRNDDGFSTLVDNTGAQKTPRRKLKKNGIDPLSQSDHVITMLSPVPCLTPPDRDTKSNRVLVRSKASVENLVPMVPSTSPSINGKVMNASPKTKPKEKVKTKKNNTTVERKKADINDGQSKNEVVIIMSPDMKSQGQKKKRSKSLTRLNLYDHESVDKKKRDPSKRRGGKKERMASISGDDTVDRSVTRRSTCSVSCAGDSPKPRLSRRQLMKKMDSESVFSAPSRACSNGRSSGRSASPRPGRTTSTLPRRRDSERGGSSLHWQGSMVGLDRSRHDLGQEQEPSGQPGSPSLLPRRGDSQRNLGNNAINVPSSATSLRRKLSANTLTKGGTEDRNELLKRIDSVNSFFGKGNGEVGSAYPNCTERNKGQESSKSHRLTQSERSDKDRPRRSYRNLSAT